jgi:hypothetical protein
MVGIEDQTVSGLDAHACAGQSRLTMKTRKPKQEAHHQCPMSHNRPFPRRILYPVKLLAVFS